MFLKKLQFQALLAAALVAAPLSLHAQFNQFTIDGQAFQVHGSLHRATPSPIRTTT
jgi:hypothetical protein